MAKLLIKRGLKLRLLRVFNPKRNSLNDFRLILGADDQTFSNTTYLPSLYYRDTQDYLEYKSYINAYFCIFQYTKLSKSVAYDNFRAPNKLTTKVSNLGRQVFFYQFLKLFVMKQFFFQGTVQCLLLTILLLKGTSPHTTTLQKKFQFLFIKSK